jgi:F-type H+-transporting ATPase subunit gamma
MRLVAMSLYNRTEKRRQESTHLVNELKTQFKMLQQHKNIFEQLRATNMAASTDELIIIISSTKGLCGGYHESLRKFLNSRTKQATNTPDLIKVGQKTHLICRTTYTNAPCVKEIELLSTANIHTVAREIMEFIYEKNYKIVRLFSNRFINFFSYKSTETILYPFSQLSESDAREQTVRHILSFNQKNESLPQLSHYSEEFNLEQSEDLISKQIIEQYGIALLTNLLLEALMAEQSARFVSMDAATKNASSALEKLKLQCNKLRQTLITREVAELSRAL